MGRACSRHGESAVPFVSPFLLTAYVMSFSGSCQYFSFCLDAVKSVLLQEPNTQFFLTCHLIHILKTSEWNVAHLHHLQPQRCIV